MKIKVKRVYEKPAAGDGFRVLIDRLWPRGISKDAAKIDLWMKGVAPSQKLRVWFHADTSKRWVEFKTLYHEEICASKETTLLKKILRKRPRNTLVTAVKDIDRSHVPILLKALGV